jgi:hypothetical protein
MSQARKASNFNTFESNDNYLLKYLRVKSIILQFRHSSFKRYLFNFKTSLGLKATATLKIAII